MQRVKFEREDSRRISPYAQFSLSCLYRKEAEPDSGSLSSIIRFPLLRMTWLVQVRSVRREFRNNETNYADHVMRTPRKK